MITLFLYQGQLIVEPEKRFSLEQIAKHPWTAKGRTDNIATARLIDDILSQEPVTSSHVNESIVDCLVRTVNSGCGGGLTVVDRETVMESVKLNKVRLNYDHGLKS